MPVLQREHRQPGKCSNRPPSVQILHLALDSCPLLQVPCRLLSIPSAMQCCGPAPAFMYCLRSKSMIFAICIILLVLWALGLATSYTAGGLIHILLVVGLVLFVVRLFQGRRIMS